MKRLESIPSPEGDIAKLELGDLIDVEAVQSLMDNFYRLAGVPMAIIDLKGKVLTGVGWQEICTGFHRVNPETCKHCVKSDAVLSAGVVPGQYKLYRCKNNLWDVATPIVVGDRHVGNVFIGQFLFQDEAVDRELFRAQARRYGFNEQEYLAALEKVPRLSYDSLKAVGAHLSKLAEMLSKLSHSNLKLAHSLAEREQKEQELERLNRTLKALSNSNQALIRSKDESRFLQEVCQIIVRDCGHALVWIGYAQEDEAKSVRPAAYAGFEEGYLETLDITWADTERGRGPTGAAIRTGKPCHCKDMRTDPQFAPWHEEALRRGYGSSLVLPLMANGRAFGAITIYSRQVDAFSEDEVKLLSELASDLAYGIGALRLRAEHARAEEELRRHQARLRQMASFPEHNPNPVLELDMAGQVLYLNPAARRLFPNLKEQGLGHPWLAGLDSAGKALQTGAQCSTSRDLKVGQRWYRQAINYVKELERIHLYGFDVTENKQAQETLQRLDEDLRRSNRDLEQFAYVASHDLQEPLRAVGGYARLLERRLSQKLDAKELEYIAGAVDGAARMERLITDLLAFARVGARGGALVATDMSGPLAEALRNLQAAIHGAHAKVSSAPLPTLPVDPTQIMQLFQNLIGNALKFRGLGPPEIFIGAQEQEGRWVFSVRDNGLGIEPQYFERIFQIFQRLHTRKHYPGTGIGLAICKKIVERHRGAIWVESRPGQGSTFCFSIPKIAGTSDTAL
jgi:signal transduction histidine kinase/ligand-binding sensor protein